MLSKNTKEVRGQVEIISMDTLVPKNYEVRKIEKAINLDFIYELVEELYSDTGRQSIDSVVL